MINPESLDLKALPSMPLSDRRNLPIISCIYFALSSGKVQYIGRSANLQQRWIQHHRQQYLDINSNIAWLEISNIDLLPQIEAALIEWFKPPLNREFADSAIKKIATKSGKARIVVCVEDDLKQSLEILAKRQRRSLSNFIEVLCQEAVNKAKKDGLLPN
jgi:hypothetical protein